MEKEGVVIILVGIGIWMALTLGALVFLIRWDQHFPKRFVLVEETKKEIIK